MSTSTSRTQTAARRSVGLPTTSLLIKRDGDMGGELPRNQTAIDRACVKEARADVALSGGAAVVCLVATGFAVRRSRDQMAVVS